MRKRHHHGLLFALAALMMTACTHTTPGTAHADPSSHVVPGLDDFAEVDPTPYYEAMRGGPVYRFVTPTGYSCGINLAGPWCIGNFQPDTPRHTESACFQIDTESVTGRAPDDPAYAVVPYDGQCPSAIPSTRAPLLDVGRKILLDTATCAVGEQGLVACIDTRHNHGFVIEPTGAWTF